MGRVRPYNLTFDPRKAVIGETMIDDLIDGLTDIVFMSGPIASHYLHKKGFDKSKFVYIPIRNYRSRLGKNGLLHNNGC